MEFTYPSQLQYKISGMSIDYTAALFGDDDVDGALAGYLDSTDVCPCMFLLFCVDLS